MYLAEAIASVQAQTYDNWEMIVADDGSPDHPSQPVVDAARDSRVRNIRSDVNRGTGATRNLAVKHSTGEFLLPIDADDLIAPTYIEKVLAKILAEDADAGYSNVQQFGLKNEIKVPQASIPEILSGGFPYNTLIVKREAFDAVGGYKSNLEIEDTQFWLYVLETGRKFVHVEEPLYFYRMHLASRVQTTKFVSRDYYRMLLEHQDTVKSHLEAVLKIWVDGATRFAEMSSTTQQTDINKEYAHLHSEFHLLLKRYEELEKRNTLNEYRLASISKSARQIAYLLAKRIGLK